MWLLLRKHVLPNQAHVLYIANLKLTKYMMVIILLLLLMKYVRNSQTHEMQK